MNKLSSQEFEQFILQFATKEVSENNPTVFKYVYNKRTKRTNYQRIDGVWYRTGPSTLVPVGDRETD